MEIIMSFSESPEFNRSNEKILEWWVPSVAPSGEAPADINDQWIGVPLPMRVDHLAEGASPHIGRHFITRRFESLEDSIFIYSVDAIKALRLFERTEAADFWQSWLDRKVIFDGLRFNAKEGRRYPAELMSIRMPGIESFDEL